MKSVDFMLILPDLRAIFCYRQRPCATATKFKTVFAFAWANNIIPPAWIRRHAPRVHGRGLPGAARARERRRDPPRRQSAPFASGIEWPAEGSRGCRTDTGSKSGSTLLAPGALAACRSSAVIRQRNRRGKYVVGVVSGALRRSIALRSGQNSLRRDPPRSCQAGSDSRREARGERLRGYCGSSPDAAVRHADRIPREARQILRPGHGRAAGRTRSHAWARARPVPLEVVGKDGASRRSGVPSSPGRTCRCCRRRGPAASSSRGTPAIARGDGNRRYEAVRRRFCSIVPFSKVPRRSVGASRLSPCCGAPHHIE